MIRTQKDIRQLAYDIGWQGEDFTLLQQAVTNPTYFEGQQGPDNQRLEYLGDAVLNMLMAEELYHRYPEAQEGMLSKIRAALVREEALATAAHQISLGDYLLLGKGSEKNGDGERDSVLSDTFEAVLGALYLSCGLEAARRMVLSGLEYSIANMYAGKYEDYKGLLQQWTQSMGGEAPQYRLLDSRGPDHKKEYFMGVFYQEKKLANAWGSSKKEAEQAAAAIAWKNRDIKKNEMADKAVAHREDKVSPKAKKPQKDKAPQKGKVIQNDRTLQKDGRIRKDAMLDQNKYSKKNKNMKTGAKNGQE